MQVHIHATREETTRQPLTDTTHAMPDAETKEIIDRETSKGRLTATFGEDGRVLRLYLDGEIVGSGTPRELPHRFARKLPDRFTHLVGDRFPITQSEYEQFCAEQKPAMSDAERARYETNKRLEEINRELDESEGGPKEARLRAEREELLTKL